MARDPNAQQSASVIAGGRISKGFALTVLFALLFLIVLRHLFGDVTISGGVR